MTGSYDAGIESWTTYSKTEALAKSMTATVLDGSRVAKRLLDETRQIVADVAAKRGAPKLVAVMVGGAPAAKAYATSQRRRCETVGITHEVLELPEDATTEQLVERIGLLNRADEVTGIMVYMPLPEAIDESTVQLQIDPYKDVEGVTPANIGLLFYEEPIFAPCTALSVMALIRESGVRIRGAEAVVVGHSRIVGKPIATLLANEMATVTTCHVATRDVASHTRRADILVVAVGKPGLMTADMVKPGAVVIDVGINRVKTTDSEGNVCKRTVGDVDFDAVSKIAGAISPVPGGVGEVTTATLLRNTAEAARRLLA